MGMLGLVKLGRATQNNTYYLLSTRPLAYTIADCTLFQARPPSGRGRCHRPRPFAALRCVLTAIANFSNGLQ